MRRLDFDAGGGQCRLCKTRLPEWVAGAVVRQKKGEDAMTNNEKDMAEIICELRAALRCVSSLLLGVLEDGCPGKGRGQDAKEASEQWWEDRYLAVQKSEELLESTNEYDGIVVG